MNRFVKIIIVILVVALGVMYYRKFTAQSNLSKIIPSFENIFQVTPTTDSDQQDLAVYKDNLPGVRDLLFDKSGVLLASQTSQGKVVAIKNGEIITILSKLNSPHGLAFLNDKLYVAQTNSVTEYKYDPNTNKASSPIKVLDLPSDGGHFTRSLLAHEGKLYVSVGSSCNVCREADSFRAAIIELTLNPDRVKVFATGLRNSVFMAVNPATNKIWATDMGRDNLGDDTPPEEVNIVESDKDYGWPNCYGQNIPDTSFNPKADCSKATAPVIEMQAHSAPLGLAFDGPDTLYVAFHGSWNRSEPTGYKVVKIDTKTKKIVDFLVAGVERPVDLLIKDKIMYISDDKAGKIYQIGL